jgi:adenylyltransferase/sulfurtransferase
MTTTGNQIPGVIGPAAGMIASIQSLEVIKYILGIGKSLENRIFRISGLDMKAHSIALVPDPHCRVCHPDTGQRM